MIVIAGHFPVDDAPRHACVDAHHDLVSRARAANLREAHRWLM